MDTSWTFLDFVAHADTVGRSLYVILILMSITSWTVMLVKLIDHWRCRARSRQWVQRFWQAPDLQQVPVLPAGQSPFSDLLRGGLQVRDQPLTQSLALANAGSLTDVYTRALRRELETWQARLEGGLTALSSIAATAPFVGLFGTVWGIYHALVAIGTQGQATLDRIAGPVGEALIMTGLGLAVAIPAVLGYQVFTRFNRVLMAEADGFAHDLLNLLVAPASAPRALSPSER